MEVVNNRAIGSQERVARKEGKSLGAGDCELIEVHDTRTYLPSSVIPWIFSIRCTYTFWDRRIEIRLGTIEIRPRIYAILGLTAAWGWAGLA